MSKYYLRVNGVGNAWPVPLGEAHPFYNADDPEQLANVSFSLVCLEEEQSEGTGSDPESPTNEYLRSGSLVSEGRVKWEILIDAGHGIVQYLIRHGNRIPDAVVLTHGHLDHTLSLDWIVQSYYRQHKKQRRYPVFASEKAWEFVSRSFPQLPPLTDHQGLLPGEGCDFEDIPELRLTMLPVFHGPHAPGAGMLVFELNTGNERRKLVFTGDLLCPLLRKADYRHIEHADMVFADANNRYPYTASNHWSISPVCPTDTKMEGFPGRDDMLKLEEVVNLNPSQRKFREDLSCTHLITNHLYASYNEVVNGYFDEFLAYCNHEIPLSVFEFTNRIRPAKVMLVHYSGMEDHNHHEQDILNPTQLENWAGAEAERYGLNTSFSVPQPGDLYAL